MDNDGILGGALNQLGQTVKQAVKKAGQQIIKLPIEAAKDVGGQIVGQKKEEIKTDNHKWSSDEERIKYLRYLYGKTDMSKDGASEPNKEEQISDKTPEEQKKLIALRNQLHKENYYDPTFNRVKKQEERPAEKVEREKKKEMQELSQKEDKKPPPLAVVREQNKAEMFRGVAG